MTVEKYYKVVKEDYKSNAMLDLLTELGYLEKSAIIKTIKPTSTIESVHQGVDPLPQTTYTRAFQAETTNPYISNGMPIESNMESIARANLGVVEDRKLWAKELKAAVKEHGHDEILNGFYEWTLAMSGTFMGKKPVSAYLKNAGQMVARPTVTNPLLEKLEKGIALCTDNKVFFTGEYRIRLALLIKEHGIQLVSQAFAEFWQSVDEKGVQWAARDFLQQAAVRINTLKEKEKQALLQAQAVAKALNDAKAEVEQDEETEEDDEL